MSVPLADSSENNGNEDMDETENYEWDGTSGGIGNESASIDTGVNNNHGTPNANSSVTREGNTPQDFFNSLVTEDILDHIVIETNWYADDYFQEHSIPPRSRKQEWIKKGIRSEGIDSNFFNADYHGHYPLSSPR